MRMRIAWSKWIVFFIGIAVIVAMRCTALRSFITLEQLKSNRDMLQLAVINYYLISVFTYIVLYVFVTSTLLPLTAVMSIAGGYLFGVIGGVIYTNIAATIGGTISFLLVRYLIGDIIQTKYKDRLISLNHELQVRGLWYLLAIRFVAIIPFPVINMLVGLTHIDLRTFIWTTSVGIIPGSVLFVIAGTQLATIESVHDIFSVPVIGLFLLLALFSLLPIFIKKRFKIV